MLEKELVKCEICGMERETTFHHLIPVTLHTNKWYQKNYDTDFLKTNGLQLCKFCHHAVHDFWDEKTLGKEYNTKEKLLETKEIQKHIKWSRKQKL